MLLAVNPTLHSILSSLIEDVQYFLRILIERFKDSKIESLGCLWFHVQFKNTRQGTFY